MTKMLRKIIAIVFVSFFIMSGLTVLTENNQNYNIVGNNINSFTSSSFNPYDFSINKSISYSSGLSSSGQVFGCYDNSLYYIYGSTISQFNFKTDKVNTFLSFSSQPRQIEIYNNYMIIGYGSGSLSISSELVNIYNFSNNKLYTFNFTNDYNYLQFSMNNSKMIISEINLNSIYIYYLTLSPITLTLKNTLSILTSYGSYSVNQLIMSGYNNNIIFSSTFPNINNPSENILYQFAYTDLRFESLNSSITIHHIQSEPFNNILDFGNCGILNSQSYYITNKNTGGSTTYTNNQYSSSLYFVDSNYKNSFIPINTTNYVFTKLPVLANNSNYQEFYYNGNLTYVYLPIGSGNTVFNTQTYIINGNNNLIIVNNNNMYVYPLYTYNLNVKSYNSLNNQIQNYFSLNGIIYTGYSNSFSFTQLPQILIPLNTSTYYYNGSEITIIQSDFTGSGSNLYYNLTIYYNSDNVQSTITSNSLYLIILYVVIGLGLAIFVIASVRYRI